MAQAPVINLTPVIIEMWIEYGIGVLVLILRIFARLQRIKYTKFTKWAPDDYFAFVALILWTFEVSMCQIIADKGSITGLTNEIASKLTPAEAKSHETGAKWLFAAWYVYVSMVWTLKAMMLGILFRVTKSLPEERLVKWASVFVFVCYLITLGVVSGHCWPTQKLWQVYPVPSIDCSQNRAKYYALVTTNVTTDLVIMALPIPVLWKLQIDIRRKLMFGLMFCAGFFIIICTLLRCIICLNMPERLDLGLSWSIRETVVGIICTNAPSIKPLLTGRNHSTNDSSHNTASRRGFSNSVSAHKMSRLQRLPDESNSGSQECIVTGASKNHATVTVDDRSSDHNTNYGTQIHVRQDFQVTEASV
ncbi:Kinesin-like protein [Fusarium austroafricanum]|uniref:Kinesin-like protein n=1 Tax=Fusarium austroafricanum TaxID=2364996 RepID=A0A8H4JR07_9HYPO|nr:Kinesin-like protein [Fusarium austroafricanum]